MMLMKSVLGRLNASIVRAGAQANARRGLHLPLITFVQLGEYSIRQARYDEWEDIFAFQFKHLHQDELPHSELYEEEQRNFHYRLCESWRFILLVAIKNSKRYMEDQKELNEKAYHVSKQKPSWFTPERKKMLGIMEKPFVTPEMGNVLGTVNLFVRRNVPHELGVLPVDPKWHSKDLNDAYVEALVADEARRNHVGTEIFRFAKDGAKKMGVEKLFMQVDTAAGLKFGASVGLKMIPTVPTVPKSKKILLGQNLGFRSL